jgi:hypothetical protein
MKIFAKIDPKTNRAAGFWNDTDHTPEEIPADTIEIAESDWQEYCNNQGARSFTSAGVLLPVPPLPEPVTLEALKLEQEFRISEARNQIDQATDRDEDTTALVKYRKAVRLLLDNAQDPTKVIWPKRPWEGT